MQQQNSYTLAQSRGVIPDLNTSARLRDHSDSKGRQLDNNDGLGYPALSSVSFRSRGDVLSANTNVRNPDISAGSAAILSRIADSSFSALRKILVSGEQPSQRELAGCNAAFQACRRARFEPGMN